MSGPKPPYDLYIYNHCPYCVRVQIIMGLKKINHNLHILANHDEQAHIKLCGSKQVPILRKPDGEVILESLDIVKLLDEDKDYPPNPLLHPASTNPNFKPLQDYNPTGKLTYWRLTKLALPELKAPESIAYFTKKKEAANGPFSEHQKESNIYKAAEEEKLKLLEYLFPESEQLNDKTGINGKNWSIDDITIFPRLRSLTCVKGFQWPKKIRAYVDHVAKLTNVELWDNKAL